jgi:anti-anti-sigma regulatory factor
MTTPHAPDLAATLVLRGPLDTTAVSFLLDRMSTIPETEQVVLDCSGVSSVDPVGAARLWMAAQRLEEAGRRFRMLALPERFLRRLRLHPIMKFADLEDAVFTDPFRGMASSR